jgi:hypothetical protein
VIDVTEILMHWHADRSKNEMAASLGVDRKTLRKYMAVTVAGTWPWPWQRSRSAESHRLTKGQRYHARANASWAMSSASARSAVSARTFRTMRAAAAA